MLPGSLVMMESTLPHAGIFLGELPWPLHHRLLKETDCYLHVIRLQFSNV